MFLQGHMHGEHGKSKGWKLGENVGIKMNPHKNQTSPTPHGPVGILEQHCFTVLHETFILIVPQRSRY